MSGKTLTPRNLSIAAVVAVLVVVAAWPGARPVDTAVLDTGAVADRFEAEGRTRVRDRYDITAPVAGIARRPTLEPGDRVRAGDEVAVLDATATPALDARGRAEARARVDAARARLAAANELAEAAAAAMRQARAEDDRQQSLLARRLVAAEAAERARTARLRAERESASARFGAATAGHELAAAEAVLEQATGSLDGPALVLRSPVDGVVLRRHFESARPVAVGEALLQIGDPAALEVEVEVLSADAARLAPGTPVELVRWGGAGVLQAQVRRVEPAGFTKVSALGVEEQRVPVIVDLAPDQPQAGVLGDGWRVFARFVPLSAEGVVRVPASALFACGEDRCAFRIQGRRARSTVVSTGLQGDGWAEVTGGLQAGDRVVVHPDRGLRDGDRVGDRGGR